MKPTMLAYAVTVLSGLLGVWGLLGVASGSPVWGLALVGALVPAASALYEVYGRDGRSAFVFFDGEGWLILTGLGAIVVGVMFIVATVQVSPDAALLFGLILLVPAVIFYVYYLIARVRGTPDEVPGSGTGEDGVSALLADDE